MPCLSPHAASAYLDGYPYQAVGTKLVSDKEALLLLRLEIARRTLQAGKVESAKEKLEACKAVLVDFAELDSSVNSAYYRVSALLQKTLGEAGEFYTCSLLYLAYTPLDSLTAEEKQVQIPLHLSIRCCMAIGASMRNHLQDIHLLIN